ncbi:NAD(P)-dependent oxidoreductase [Piscibacillus halophilus]|uniref:D-3-phosphoglycerate dehydrogenase n=1 Tax=Piscibacillus halophilus TaxID=571933 RepID=A0A1H9KE57_9BACI|nr:hydroxyacid dehydrogenase [Piscibacillus halophilus]SEQ97359.1 D-3-phosphoglycerate dehydrogenase [Piscibacillus halophilus]
MKDQPHVLQILSMYHIKGEEVLNELAQVKKFDEFHEQEIVRYLNEHPVDGIILRAPARITPAILDAGQHLKAISGAGIGLDNIDVEYATQKGVKVMHAPKINVQATAEHAVSLILAVMKNIIPFHEEMKKGNFGYRDGRFTYELKGKTLGLVGFGSISQKVASIMQTAFGMNILIYVRRMTEEREVISEQHGYHFTTNVDDVFREADIVSVHIPLNELTRHFVQKKHFELMKPNAVFINTARGGVINQEDLAQVLKEKKILGAGVDVYDPEPPLDNHPFYDLDNIVMTPHIGGISEEAARETTETIAENLIKAIQGEVVDTIVN